VDALSLKHPHVFGRNKIKNLVYLLAYFHSVAYYVLFIGLFWGVFSVALSLSFDRALSLHSSGFGINVLKLTVMLKHEKSSTIASVSFSCLLLFSVLCCVYYKS